MRPWHFQWLDAYYLHRDLKRLLPTLGGAVLDVGCGIKPYQGWFGPLHSYVGLDVVSGPQVDVVVKPDGSWPLPDEHFDVLLSTQVLEHVEDLDLTVKEIVRVLKPGGVALITFPFLYNEHGAPYDFRRMTIHMARRLLQGFQITRLERHGGIGSTQTILLLNWLESTMNLNFATRLMKAVLLLPWLVLCFAANMLGLVVDKVDRTKAFYNNVLLVARKPEVSPRPKVGAPTA